MKIKRALIASGMFLILLLFFYYVHVKFFRVDVILYSSILDGVIATLVATGILFGFSYFNLFNVFEKTQMAAIWLLAGYIFAISIPTVIDRSLSFYILEKLQQRGGGIQLAKFEEIFTQEYVKEHRLVDVRLTEQQESGTITIQDGCVKITDLGNRLATFSRAFRRELLPKKRLLMGQYSDDLVDPFKSDIQHGDYRCN